LPLLIPSYEDPEKAYSDCLKELKATHQYIEREVDFKQKDRKHAIYLLLGATIDVCRLALRFKKEQYAHSLLELYRYLLEASSLIEYFIVDDSEVENWFNGEFIETRLKKKPKKNLKRIVLQKARIPFHQYEPEKLIKREQTLQEIFNNLSKYCHPTIGSIKMGFISADSVTKIQTQELPVQFGNHFLRVVINLSNDVSRTIFKSVEEVNCLTLSEFGVLFSDKSI